MKISLLLLTIISLLSILCNSIKLGLTFCDGCQQKCQRAGTVVCYCIEEASDCRCKAGTTCPLPS